MSQPIDLFKGAKNFFDTDEAYQEFCRKFAQEVAADLEEYREARQRSEEETGRHWIAWHDK